MTLLNLFCCGNKYLPPDETELTVIRDNSTSATASNPRRPVPNTTSSNLPGVAGPGPTNADAKDLAWVWNGREIPDYHLRNLIGIAATHGDFTCRLFTDSVAGIYKALSKIDGMSLDRRINNLKVDDRKVLYEEPVGDLTNADLYYLAIVAALEMVGPKKNLPGGVDIDRLLAVYRWGVLYLDVDEKLKAKNVDWGSRVEKQKLPQEYRHLILSRKKLPHNLVAKYGLLGDGFQAPGGRESSFANSMLKAPPQSPIVGNALKKIVQRYKEMSQIDLEEIVTDVLRSLSGLHNQNRLTRLSQSTVARLEAREGSMYAGKFQNAVTGELKRQAMDVGRGIFNSRVHLTVGITGPIFLKSELDKAIRAAGDDPKKINKEISIDYDLEFHEVPDAAGPWTAKIKDKPVAEAEDILPGSNGPTLPYLNDKTRAASEATRSELNDAD